MVCIPTSSVTMTSRPRATCDSTYQRSGPAGKWPGPFQLAAIALQASAKPGIGCSGKRFELRKRIERGHSELRQYDDAGTAKESVQPLCKKRCYVATQVGDVTLRRDPDLDLTVGGKLEQPYRVLVSRSVRVERGPQDVHVERCPLHDYAMVVRR